MVFLPTFKLQVEKTDSRKTFPDKCPVFLLSLKHKCTIETINARELESFCSVTFNSSYFLAVEER